jgi:hypothetical protein
MRIKFPTRIMPETRSDHVPSHPLAVLFRRSHPSFRVRFQFGHRHPHCPVVQLHDSLILIQRDIHMSDIPSFPYRLLWEERQLVSVANLTRQDGIDFLRLAPAMGIVTQTTRYPLNQANQALADLRAGRFDGAAVLVP